MTATKKGAKKKVEELQTIQSSVPQPMRTLEDVETKESILLNTINSINELEDSGSISSKTADEYRAVVQSTVNLFEWFKGNDVEIMTSIPVLDKVLLLAADVDLFKSIELDD